MRDSLGQDGHGQRDERAAGELDRGERRGVATSQQPWLERYECRRQEHGTQYEQIARRGGATARGARDQGDPDQRYAVPGPDARPGRALAKPGREHGHQNGDRAHDHRSVAHAGALDAGVLEHDHRAEPDRPRGEHANAQRVAQAAPPDETQHRRSHREADNGKPSRPEPRECELRQRDVQAPQGARGGEGEDRGSVGLGLHTDRIGESAPKYS